MPDLILNNAFVSQRTFFCSSRYALYVNSKVYSLFTRFCYVTQFFHFPSVIFNRWNFVRSPYGLAILACPDNASAPAFQQSSQNSSPLRSILPDLLKDSLSPDDPFNLCLYDTILSCLPQRVTHCVCQYSLINPWAPLDRCVRNRISADSIHCLHHWMNTQISDQEIMLG